MQHIYDGFRVNRQPCQCVCTPKICRMPHKSLFEGWTLLILPPGDFEDLYRVSNPKTSGTPERNRTSAPWVRAKCTTVIRQGYLMAAPAGFEPTTFESKSNVLPVTLRGYKLDT